MRYKIVTCILLILSVFCFVLAAPVPVREVREAYADAAEGDENVIIVSRKRARRGYEGSESDLSDRDYLPSYQSPSSPDYASWSHPGVDKPSSPSAGSAPGGTEVPLNPEGPGTTIENRPASSSSESPKSVSWGPTKVHSYGPDPPPPLSPPPGREGYLRKVAQQPPLPKIEHASLWSYFEPPPQPPPKPQSNGFFSKFKKFFGKLGKLKFRPWYRRTVDTGVLTDGNLGEISNAPATSATDGVLRRGADLSYYPKSRRKQSASHGSANPMEDIWSL